ncbi:hypothetical protein B0H63DRAFT_517813 [Podospora didyma]|uniref:Uncharacterized protein n=1 Tax=Podospora didyma TaxID=330526 RepID=A0AAE0P7E7_9PEZI|nr:hypothetical protein B0H63DRAFT_517813 [Podospora didyma]
MATNSGRGNPIGARDGPQVETAPAPPLPADLKSQISEEVGSTGEKHAGGKDTATSNNLAGKSQAEIEEVQNMANFIPLIQIVGQRKEEGREKMGKEEERATNPSLTDLISPHHRTQSAGQPAANQP